VGRFKPCSDTADLVLHYLTISHCLPKYSGLAAVFGFALGLDSFAFFRLLPQPQPDAENGCRWPIRSPCAAAQDV